MHDVVLDGSATHGHPRALVGATAYAYAAWSLARKTGTLRFGELLETLLDGASEWSRFPESARTEKSWLEVADDVTNARFHRIWDQTTREMLDLLEKAHKGLTGWGSSGRSRGSWRIWAVSGAPRGQGQAAR